MQFPILYYERNLVVNRQGEWWAAYRVRPWTYEHLNQTEQVGWWQRLTRLFAGIEGEGQLLVVPRTIPAAAPMMRLAARAAGPLAHFGTRYLEELCRHAGDEPAVEYDTILLYRLPKPARAGGAPMVSTSQITHHLRRARRAFDEWRRGLPVLVAAVLEAYVQEEEQFHARLQGMVRVDRCTPEQITWLIQRRYWAGISEPPGRPGWEPDALSTESDGDVQLEPLSAEILSLAEGEVDLRHPRQLVVRQVHRGSEAAGYQAYMAMAAIPDEMTMPGAEWIYRLQDLRFPVDVCVRWSTIPYREAIAVLRRKRMETADQVEQATSTGDVPPLDVTEAEAQIEQWEQELKDRRHPALESTVFFSVAAATEQQLWQRVTALRDVMADIQMPLEIPTGDQHRLFLEFHPGGYRQIRPTGAYSPDPPYLHRLIPEVLAAAMAGATHDLGDPTGAFVGRTGALGRPVYWQPSRGPKVNRSASAAFLGTLGGGKTFTARLLALQAVMTQGARALLIDPKGESEHLVAHLPAEVRQQTNLITLSARPEDTGLLDLLAMARTGARREAGNVAVSVLSFIADARTREEQLAIHEAVEAALRAEAPSMAMVIDHLLAVGGVAQEMGRFLSHLRGRAYANLLFGDGRERSLNVRAPLNILQLQHLNLPERGKAREDMTVDEVISAGVMYAVVAFAAHFVSQDRHVFKLVLLDEAWKVMANSTGLGVVRHLLRTGRAMNAGIYIISQSVTDLLDEGIRNNLGAKFVFRSTDQAEVEGVLQFLNMEASPRNVATIRELDNGECLVQDLDGRIGVVQIDAVFKDLIEAFDTRPPAAVASTR